MHANPSSTYPLLQSQVILSFLNSLLLAQLKQSIEEVQFKQG